MEEPYVGCVVVYCDSSRRTAVGERTPAAVARGRPAHPQARGAVQPAWCRADLQALQRHVCATTLLGVLHQAWHVVIPKRITSSSRSNTNSVRSSSSSSSLPQTSAVMRGRWVRRRNGGAHISNIPCIILLADLPASAYSNVWHWGHKVSDKCVTQGVTLSQLATARCSHAIYAAYAAAGAWASYAG